MFLLFSCTAVFSCSMKRAPQVVPPPSPAVRDQLRGVQQIHVLPQWQWLGYGSPYPPLRIDGWHVLKNKPKVKVKPSCQQGGWNGEDWKDWNDSSDWSQHSTWTSWSSKEEWIQDERYQEIQEKDMVEDNHTDEEYEDIMEEPETQVLQHHRGEAPVFHRALKRRHPVKGRRGKASCKQHKARNAMPTTTVEVGELRYSQLSCAKRFKCGRPISKLVQALMDGDVDLSASFLRLTVYEATDSENVPVLKSIDNRRLLALKEYAKRSGKEVLVNVDFVSHDTVKKVQRIIQNSDKTDGREVRVRGGSGGRRTNNKNRYWGRF